LPRPEPRDAADLLLRKASSDLAAARALADDIDQQDDVVGFHAQQAVEKSIKAVLSTVFADPADVPRNHDISLLLRLLARHGVDIPPHLGASRLLSAWAVTMRYDDLEETLDRGAAVQAAADAIEWAHGFVRPTTPDSP
jgi:HEPN domain-containing protein